MQIELNQNECQQVKLALVNLAKKADTNEAGMLQLLLLSRKFIWQDQIKMETSKIRKETKMETKEK